MTPPRISTYLLRVLFTMHAHPRIADLQLLPLSQRKIRSYHPDCQKICSLHVDLEMPDDSLRPVAFELLDYILRERFIACVGTMDPDHPPPPAIPYFTAEDPRTHVGLSIVQEQAYVSLGLLGLCLQS